MTRNELNILKDITGRGVTAIYKVAKALGRTPKAWEVLTLNPPTRRGRKSKYVIFNPSQRDAITVRHKLDILLEYSNSDNLKYRAYAFDVVCEWVEYSSLAYMELTPVWVKALKDISLLSENEMQELDLSIDEVMLRIIRIINSVLYGGTL